MSDVRIALDKIRALIGEVNPDSMWFLVHPGAPASKARARWDMKRRRTYTPEKTRLAEEALAWRFKEVMRGNVVDGPVAIIAIFYRPNFQRIDADNLMKLVLDSATSAGVWADDCHVAALACYMEHDPDKPRTVIAWCPTESSLDRRRSTSCRTCGKEFNYSSRGNTGSIPKFCSRDCFQRPRAEVPCGYCRKPFKRPHKASLYCSNDCRHDARRRKGHPKASCVDCGVTISKRGYGRCRKCWLAAPASEKLGIRMNKELSVEDVQG